MSTRVSVVLGAARGIGAATATALAARGDAVVLVDRAANDPRLPYPLGSEEDLERAATSAREVAADKDLVATAIVDATDFEAVTEVLARTEDRFGGIDAIVVCAGVIAGGRPLWEMPGDEVDAV
ncbi:MAG: SDR family NAD(P)-dependent oxidoreductase, partial [Solirubrobacteraceae bacterium]